MEKPFLRYKGEKHYFEIPDDWQILTLAAFQDQIGEKDVEQLTREVLNKPIGSAPLKECISSSDRIAILIEDQTRASPKKRILKILLEELGRAQVPKENISIIVSLGTHRALTAEELKDNYGEEVVQQYSIYNHDCQAPDLVPVAKLKTGTVVKINKRVHDATFKIGIGSIFPHPMNGFGGGCKILFPGVSNFDAILEHHLRYSFRGDSRLGTLGGNAKEAGLNFILNSVLDHNDHLYDLVGGDPVEAHQKGSDICKEIVSRTFQKKADLTVTSAFPYTEGLQIMKPLAPTSMITKEGGCIILLAHCTSPLPEDYLKACERIRQEYSSNLRESILGLFEKNQRLLEGSSPEYNMSMTQALLGQDMFNVILVTEDIPRESVERLGFLHAKDLDQAFSMSASFNSAPEVHIIPSGGVILPTLENE
jgi:nickel-dependent lactate racemase